jgi:hypothetical protein
VDGERQDDGHAACGLKLLAFAEFTQLYLVLASNRPDRVNRCALKRFRRAVRSKNHRESNLIDLPRNKPPRDHTPFTVSDLRTRLDRRNRRGS